MPMVSWRPLLGQLELGADAVGAGHQHRLAVLARQVEQRAEAAQAAHHLGPEAALDQRLDALDHFVARVDIDAGVAVGSTFCPKRWRISNKRIRRSN
jgi:hypothetical protein